MCRDLDTAGVAPARDRRASPAYVAPMLSIAYIATRTRVVQILALVLVAATLLLAFGLIGGDDAQAGMVCRARAC
jgi:hypothetical protein